MNYGFIGCGNMGGALAAAAAKSVGGANLRLADADGQKAQALADRIGAAVTDVANIAAECDYIVLGVKPQGMAALLAELPIREGAVLVSMAAGLSTETLAKMLGKEVAWIRIMPNTPVAVGEGRILYTVKNADASVEEGFLNLFKEAGKLYKLQEDLIDAGTALSGCGPAFVYLFIEALAEAGIEVGVPAEIAVELAEGTVLGAAKLAIESGRAPADLRQAVCSPGGSTIEGVKALESADLRAIVKDAVNKSYIKTKELGK